MKTKNNFLTVIAMLLLVSMLFSACGKTGQPKNPDSSGTSADKLPDNIMQKSDPSEDDTLNILMVGNSFCYYYPDELYGIATAAGV